MIDFGDGTGRRSRTAPRRPGARVVAVTVLAVVLAPGLFVAFRPKTGPSDREQIRDLFTTAETAARNHDVPAIVSVISKNYRDDVGNNRDRLRLIVARVFRNEADIWAGDRNLSIAIHGDNADVSADITIESRASGSTDIERGTYPLTVQLRKEPGYRFLVIPTWRWRVVSAQTSGIFGGIDLFDLLGG